MRKTDQNTIMAESRKEKEEQLKELFRFTDLGHPAMNELYELALCREVEVPIERQSSISEKQKTAAPLAPLELLLGEVKIPAVPKVIIELLQVINDPTSNANDLAEVIGMDTGLSSHLLRIVNSAYYNFPFPIDTVQRAVALMGTREISLMAFSASFLKLFKQVPTGGIDVEEFWKHSIGCGMAARAIAAASGRTNPERHFLAGLLHDIGRLVLASNLPGLTKELAEAGEKKNIPLYLVEWETSGFDHGRFGGALLRKWNFPATLVSAVHYHHQMEENEEYEEPATVHLADIVVKSLGLGFSGEAWVPPLSDRYWKKLNLAPEELVKIADEVCGRVEEMFQGLLGAGGGAK